MVRDFDGFHELIVNRPERTLCFFLWVVVGDADLWFPKNRGRGIMSKDNKVSRVFFGLERTKLF